MKKLTLLLFVFITGCATMTWRIEGPSQASNGLLVSINAKAWKYSPSDLDSYVLPILLEVENREKEAVAIKREDVFLLDEKGNQYNPLQPGDVVSMLRGGYGGGLSFSIGYWSSPFGVWWSPYYGFPPQDRVYPDIVNKAFAFGEIQPGAKISGFVYFPKMPRDVKALTLSVKGYKFKLKADKD